jgi:predicted choloylglycine hydrolase
MSYNVTLFDATGDYTKVFLSPGESAIFSDDPVSTNHQVSVSWLEYAEFSRTIERYNFLKKSLLLDEQDAEGFVQSFFKKPLFNTNFKNHFGTLYTSIYSPREKMVSLLWKGHEIGQSFDEFNEGITSISIAEE